MQFHPEKNITSAQDRYLNEVKRVWSVIDYHLTRTGKPYLVGDKVCFADLMFVTWNNAVVGMLGKDFERELEEKSPKAWEWHQRLVARESVKKTYDAQERAKAALGRH